MILEFYGTYSAFAYATILGSIIGLLYDVFRIIRISRLPYIAPKGRFFEIIKIPERKHLFKRLFFISDNLLTFAEDTVFWIIASILEILFIYHINNGAIRVYFIMCTVLGATIYFFTIGKITIYFSVRIIFLIRCLLYWGIYIIIYPIRVIFHFIIKVSLFIVSKTIIPVVETVKKQSLNSYSKKRASHILIQSKKGFVYDQI